METYSDGARGGALLFLGKVFRRVGRGIGRVGRVAIRAIPTIVRAVRRRFPR